MDNQLSSGYLSKRGPLPLHIWSNRYFVLEAPKGIELERLRLVYEKNVKKRKTSSSPVASTKEFESLNATLFRCLSAATVSGHGFLAYYKSNSPPDLLTPLGLINLREVKKVQVVCRKITKDYVVSLKTETRTHLFAAANMTLAKAWETSINERMALLADEEESIAFKHTYEKLVTKTAFPKIATPIQPANETSDATPAAASDAEPSTETDSECEPVVTTTKPTDDESKPTEVVVVAETEPVVEAETKIVEEAPIETETKVAEEVQIETETKVVEESPAETETNVVAEVPAETVEPVVADETVEEATVPDESVVPEPTSRKNKRKSFLVTAFASMKKGKAETSEVASEPTMEEIVPEVAESSENSNEEVPSTSEQVVTEEPKPESTVHSPLAEVKKAINAFFYPKKETVPEPVADVVSDEEHEATIVEESTTSEVSEHDEIALVVDEAVEAAATEIASKEEEKKEEIVVKRKRSMFLDLFRTKKLVAEAKPEEAPTAEEKASDVVEETTDVVVEVATEIVEETKPSEVHDEITRLVEEAVEAAATEIASEKEEKKEEIVVRRKRSMFLDLFRTKKVVVEIKTEGTPTSDEKDTDVNVVVEEAEGVKSEVTPAEEVKEATEEVPEAPAAESVKADVTETVEKQVVDPEKPLTTVDAPAETKKGLNLKKRFSLFVGKTNTETPVALKEDSNITITEAAKNEE